MKQTKWNEGWKYWPDKDAFALVWNIPENAREVTLPHDAMIESPARADSPNGGNTGYRDGGNYTYVKILHVSEKETGQKFILRFDGVYCHALVYVNEQLAGSEANGYSTVYVYSNTCCVSYVNLLFASLLRSAGDCPLPVPQ